MELLVVIAIIAILSALSLASLARARETGRKAVCIGNLRQLHLGGAVYTADNNDFLPQNYQFASDSDGNSFSWAWGTLTYETMKGLAPWSYTSPTNHMLLVPGGPGSIGNYVLNAKSYRCPSDRSWIELGGRRHDRVRSYSLNAYIGHSPSQQLAKGPHLIFRKESAFTTVSPSEIMEFVDQHEDSMDGPAFDTWMERPGQERWGHFPASRHNNGAGISFVDGSVRGPRWRDPRTVRKMERIILPPEPSPNNKDLQWLMLHATRKK